MANFLTYLFAVLIGASVLTVLVMNPWFALCVAAFFAVLYAINLRIP